MYDFDFQGHFNIKHRNQGLEKHEIKVYRTFLSRWEAPFLIQRVVIWNSWEARSVWRQRPFSYHQNEIPRVLEVKVSAPVSLFCDCDKVLNIRGWQMWFRPPTAASTGRPNVAVSGKMLCDLDTRFRPAVTAPFVLELPTGPLKISQWLEKAPTRAFSWWKWFHPKHLRIYL